jgi:predicted  nucleic acid-binding Zn-ribbon protein
MNTTAFARKTARERDHDADGMPLEPMAPRSQRWSDRIATHRPLTARHDVERFDGVSKPPANDDLARSRGPGGQTRVPLSFIGSRYFWAAAIATVAFCLIFTLIMGFTSAKAFAALFRNPLQFSPFLLSMVVIAAIQWLLAMSAHRQAVNYEMWRRMLSLTQKLNDPGPVAEEASRNLSASFDRLVSDLDARMAALDERTSALSQQMTTIMQQSEVSADLNITQMRNIADATEVQKDALQRIGAAITAEVLPVINKLEGTVASLEDASQSAGGILGAVGVQLQQSTRELQVCLEEFNRANHTIAPEIEKRVARFEATISRLPDQLEATLSRLNPISETISDAAMLSTANVDVMEQLAKEITSSLDNNRALFKEFSEENTELFRHAVDGHVERFRDLLTGVITEEVTRLSAMSRELGFLAETASSLVDKLHHPVSQVSATANKALSEMNTSVAQLDERIQKNMSASVAQLNTAASHVISAVSREIEAATIALQTRLAASSNDLVQRVNTDAARFESLIDEAAEKTSSRVAEAIRDLPAALALRMEGEIAKVDGSLKGSIVGLSDQMRTIIDGIPSRLTSMTRETLQALESNLERSFEGVAQRSERLNEQFRQHATETTEAVLENYVDFIFLALKRFRSEMDVLNTTFRKELEASLAVIPVPKEPFAISKPTDIDITPSLETPAPIAEAVIVVGAPEAVDRPAAGGA